MKGSAALARSRKNKTDTKSEDSAESTASPGEVEDAEVIEEIPAEPDSGSGEKAARTDAEKIASDGADESPDAGDAATADEASQDNDSPSLEDQHGDDAESVGVEEPAKADEQSALADSQDETSDEAGEGDTEQPDRTADDQAATQPEGKSEPADPEQKAPPPSAEPETRPSAVPYFVAAIGGGVLAALLGFLAAQQLDTTEVPDGPTPEDNAAALAALDDRIGALSSQLDEVAARDMAATAAAAVTPVTDALSEADARLSAVSDRISELAERVETIAMRPTATGIEADEFDAALGQFREQLNATIANAQTEIEAARVEAERISEEAYSAEQAALARAAWGQVATAIESGAGFKEPLNTLESLAGADIPEALLMSAEDGVPTLASLQQAFPDAARIALETAVRAETGDAPIDRLTAYLRVQSGYRSLAPREGEDPDAILSRVEGALRGGDLGAALAELQSLDGPGREALAEWEAMALARIAAIEAAEAVSGQLNSN